VKILLLEPYYGGSHRQWVDGWVQHSQHDIKVYTLPGSHWKWRLHGAAITFADRFMADNFIPDLILASDMLDFSSFLGLVKSKAAGIRTAIYFHENQLAYPWSPTDGDVKDRRDNHYKFINYTSALVADRVFFNSEYNRSSFLSALVPFLKAFPDHQNKHTVDLISTKSEVLSLGLDLQRFDQYAKAHDNPVPVALWNHRWEYDKNPDLFFQVLFELQAEGLHFELILLGQSYKKSPTSFREAKATLGDKIIHYGYVDNFVEYASFLWKADILPVTSHQDFFGGSIVEAMYCGCLPLLPDRLAYPQHVRGMEADTLYSDEQDFKNKLKALIVNHDTPKPNIKKLIAKYDWKKCIDAYDQAFKNV